MKVLTAASEVHPFAKTGGLADVLGALPKALADAGLDVVVCMPLYRQVREAVDDLTVVDPRVPCPFAGGNRPFGLLEGRLPQSDVPIYFVENPGVFEVESNIYGAAPGAFGDGHLRFLYFSRAVCRVPRATGFHPDVIHVHDWQTSLVPALARTVYKDDPVLSAAAYVLTIHNMAYQGVFPVADLNRAGLPDFLIHEGRLMERGEGNLLAGGIRFADGLNTVSETYAREILDGGLGAGLEPVLDWRRDFLEGIVNGLDVGVWNPTSDPHLPTPFDAESLDGKAACKAALLEELGLLATEGPVLAVVSRFVEQKGLDLLLPVLDGVLRREPDLRVAVLGSGSPEMEDGYRDLALEFPDQVVTRLGFDAPLSHRIEAGADFFVMPSQFEPCGINQLISMQYGTPPIVRATGGLADTVTPATNANLLRGNATGFVFREPTTDALGRALDRAIKLYRDDPAALAAMRRAGMTTDWSWTKAARRYVALFESARRRAADGSHLHDVLWGLPPDPLEVELPPLPDIPDHYDRDLLVAFVRDPGTLYVRWALTGSETASWRETLPADARVGLRFELVAEDLDRSERTSKEVRDRGDYWLHDLIPGTRYRVSLRAFHGNRTFASPLVPVTRTLPGDAHPES